MGCKYRDDEGVCAGPDISSCDPCVDTYGLCIDSLEGHDEQSTCICECYEEDEQLNLT